MLAVNNELVLLFNSPLTHSEPSFTTLLQKWFVFIFEMQAHCAFPPTESAKLKPCSVLIGSFFHIQRQLSQMHKWQKTHTQTQLERAENLLVGL